MDSDFTGQPKHSITRGGGLAIERTRKRSLFRIESNLFWKFDFSPDTNVWELLTEEQKREVFLSCEESEDDNNLMSWEEVKKSI